MITLVSTPNATGIDKVMIQDVQMDFGMCNDSYNLQCRSADDVYA